MKTHFAAVLFSAFAVATSCFAQAFPSRPIDLVVTSNPGGGVDLLFRLLAEEMTKNLKTQVNVTNQAAASGAIATEKVAAAKKDGHTLLGALLGQVATMNVANPKGPAHLQRHFQPVALLYGYAAVILLSRADSEFKTVKDIVAFAQKKPGEIIVGVGPTGTSLTLEIELLKRAAKVNLTSLPLAGSAQTITNLLGGHVHLAMASDVAALPHIKAGKLRGVAVDVDSVSLPEVPTFAKQGYPQVNLLAHLAFLAPKGTPDGVLKALADSIRKSLQDPKLQENLKSRGYNIDLRTGKAALDKVVEEEFYKYNRFSADELGWKPQ
jgi:tripartite-type tricarboxylate transporter receptor subunit TctC